MKLVGRLVETISSHWTCIDFLISENRSLNGDSNPDLCDADAVLHQLIYQADWELVVMRVDCNPVDAEIYIHLMLIISHLFELQIETKFEVCDARIFF